MDIRKITIIGGQGKDAKPETVGRVELCMGNIVSIVGPTGCGKTTLINDIELFANRNTPSGRQIMINDEAVPDDLNFDPAKHPIALISQHTNFLSDLPVGEFLSIHAKVRGAAEVDKIENAGIHKTKALQLLKQYEKIFVFVTHDPTIALFSDFRIIMKNGAMQNIVVSNPEERIAADKLKQIDDITLHFRGLIRSGEEITKEHLELITY